jgi:hypothetical protein
VKACSNLRECLSGILCCPKELAGRNIGGVNGGGGVAADCGTGMGAFSGPRPLLQPIDNTCTFCPFSRPEQQNRSIKEKLSNGG